MTAKRSGPTGRRLHSRVKTARGRSTSSQRWLARQLNDPFVAAARQAGYRSRAAWKLVEIDDRFHLLRPGAKVVDLGSAPGGWTQVAVDRCIGKKSGGKVVAVDRLVMQPVEGAAHLQLDMTDAAADQLVLEALGGPADVVLCDMAPAATGHRPTDHIRVMALCEAAFEFAKSALKPGGALLVKVLQGGTESQLLAQLKLAFAVVRHVKPPASRADSAESYLLATGFRWADSEKTI
jgi:23S rRNA (uridine2552-2'-O)-methyltransferase